MSDSSHSNVIDAAKMKTITDFITGEFEMKRTTVGVDIAKSVFQLHWVDADTGEIVNKQLKRAVFLEHFANREPCLIGMEACGGSQHWARRLTRWAIRSS